MGRHHLNEMKRAGMTPVAVAEKDESRLSVAEADFPGIKTYTTVEAMLAGSEVNLVTLITPHNTHAELGLACLRAGKHVVCEKPLAITTDECDAMIAEAKRQNTVLSTYHNRHWDGCILKALEVVKSGVLGEVYRIEASMGGYGQPQDWWRTSKSISGGILYDWGVHLLEYSFQILGAPIAEVSGYNHRGFWNDLTAWKEDTNEDVASATVRLTDGAWIELSISALEAHPSPYWLTISGTKGTHRFHHGEYETTVFENQLRHVTSGKSPESEGWKLYQNIADHLVDGEALIITPEWARRPIHVLDLAFQSAILGKAIPVTYT